MEGKSNLLEASQLNAEKKRSLTQERAAALASAAAAAASSIAVVVANLSACNSSASSAVQANTPSSFERLATPGSSTSSSSNYGRDGLSRVFNFAYPIPQQLSRVNSKSEEILSREPSRLEKSPSRSLPPPKHLPSKSMEKLTEDRNAKGCNVESTSDIALALLSKHQSYRSLANSSLANGNVFSLSPSIPVTPVTPAVPLAPGTPVTPVAPKLQSKSNGSLSPQAPPVLGPKPSVLLFKKSSSNTAVNAADLERRKEVATRDSADGMNLLQSLNISQVQTGSSLSRQRHPEKARQTVVTKLDATITSLIAGYEKLENLSLPEIEAWSSKLIETLDMCDSIITVLLERYAALPMTGNAFALLDDSTTPSSPLLQRALHNGEGRHNAAAQTAKVSRPIDGGNGAELRSQANSGASSPVASSTSRAYSVHRLREDVQKLFRTLKRLMVMQKTIAEQLHIGFKQEQRIEEQLSDLQDQLIAEIVRVDRENIRQYRLETRLRSVLEAMLTEDRTLQQSICSCLRRASVGLESDAIVKAMEDGYHIEGAISELNIATSGANDACLKFKRDDVTCTSFRRHILEKDHQNYFVAAENSNTAIVSVSTQGSKTFMVLRSKLPQHTSFVECSTSSLIDVGGAARNSVRDVISRVYPELGNITKVKRATDLRLDQRLLKLDELGVVERYKFGVLYCAPGQSTEEDMYNNEFGSPLFEEVLELLGERSLLYGFKGYAAGLDTKEGLTGTEVIHTFLDKSAITFHVSTLLPFAGNDPQQIQRKRHIGNDIVTLVIAEGNCDVNRSSFRSHFLHVLVIVQVYPNDFSQLSSHMRLASAKTGSGGSPELTERSVQDSILARALDRRFVYRVTVLRNRDVPSFGPELPNPAVFTSASEFRGWLIPYLVEAESASYCAEQFAKPQLRTRHNLIDDMYQDGVNVQHRSNSLSASNAASNDDEDKQKKGHRKAFSSRVGFISKKSASNSSTVVEDGDQLFPAIAALCKPLTVEPAN